MQHILIVDDVDMVAYSFQRYFEHHGYRVTVAYDGPSALAAIQNAPIDGVVTDYRMPGMNGMELLAKLRNKHPTLPALVVSAYTQEIEMQESRLTRIFRKPAALQDILNAMKSMLEHKDTGESGKTADS
jgi:CheY-like chemotaxis protein